MTPVLIDNVQFGYSQFGVYDLGHLAAFLWTEIHFHQGFARGESEISFRTLTEFGTARVRVFTDTFDHTLTYDLAIAVPFLVVNGLVAVEGPEEVLLVDRKVRLAPGPYRLVAAQTVVQGHNETDEPVIDVDLYFEKRDQLPARSEILIGNPQLDPPPVLLETAEQPSVR